MSTVISLYPAVEMKVRPVPKLFSRQSNFALSEYKFEHFAKYAQAMRLYCFATAAWRDYMRIGYCNAGRSRDNGVERIRAANCGRSGGTSSPQCRCDFQGAAHLLYLVTLIRNAAIRGDALNWPPEKMLGAVLPFIEAVRQAMKNQIGLLTGVIKSW